MMVSGHSASRGLDPLGVVLAMTACFPLLAHRRAPLVTFAVCTLASGAIDALGYVLGPPVGPTIALFYIATDPRTHNRMRPTALVVVGLGTVHLAAAAVSFPGFPTTAILGAIILWGGAWIIGDQLRQRRQRLADLIDRAERAERETERERRLAAAEERTRIARDLHDSAAHAINVILVQAGGARLLQHQDPAATRNALSTIEDVARETIADIDRLIRGLRGTDVITDVPSAIEPPTGLATAGTLADRHRAAGLAVQIHIDGRPRPIAPSVDQAAYRILQESLTNAARHGTGAADVQIAYRPDEVTLTISNPLTSNGDATATHRGHGLLGMRERAALLGGQLRVDRHNGQFRVHARLPTPILTTPG
jgi:signal transduction histidine kinase